VSATGAPVSAGLALRADSDPSGAVGPSLENVRDSPMADGGHLISFREHPRPLRDVLAAPRVVLPHVRISLVAVCSGKLAEAPALNMP
jgi:hypothetical protein